MGGFFTKIFSKLSGKKQLKIIIIGLDNSGKTTILNKLHLNQVKQTVPTIGFNMQTVQYKNLKFQVWDLGGQNSIRYKHKIYLIYIDNIGKCIILLLMLFFMLLIVKINKDLLKHHNNYQKFQTYIFFIMILQQKQILQNVPLLVLANKQDLPDSASQKDISQVLGLSKIKNRDWSIYKCSAVTGVGLNQSMDWLVQKLAGNA